MFATDETNVETRIEKETTGTRTQSEQTSHFKESEVRFQPA